MNLERVRRARELARSRGFSAVTLMPGPNLFYFSGLEYHVSERPALGFLPAEGEPFAWCPGFEAGRMQEAGFSRVYPWGEVEGPLPALQQAFQESGVGAGTLGVEFLQMRVLELSLCQAAGGPGLAYADAGPLLAELRMVKDDLEIGLLEKAATFCDAGMAAAHRAIRPGVTEVAVAAEIAREMDRLGFTGQWHVMVASGPRSAVPHAGTTERIMQDGELCWVDMVVHYQGYVGDITRTFPVGTVSGQAAEIFRICLEAQARARAAARPGLTGAELDRIARGYISQRGYGEYFTHRTGHGLGLEVHEEPYLVGSNQRPLAAGNVFTIEPGIYLPGLGGVRIEDDVVLTPAGARVLTQYPRDLLAGGPC